jgi:Mor family transcriptional regulator
MPDQRAEVEDAPNLVYPRLVAEMYDVLKDAYTRDGLEKGQAMQLAKTGVEALGFYFGGRAIYLPRGEAMRRQTRNACLYAEFTGGNHRDLADRYGITVSQVYKILEAQAELLKRRREGRRNPENPCS